MINVRTMRKLANNDGLTLKNGKIITYKTGWQVADYGKEAAQSHEETGAYLKAFHTPEAALLLHGADERPSVLRLRHSVYTAAARRLSRG